MNQVALQRRITDVLEEYAIKQEAAEVEISEFSEAGKKLEMAAVVGGTYGGVSLDVGRVYIEKLRQSLLQSAWRNVYEGLQIKRIASAKDKKRFDQFFEKPEPFTLENLRNIFGDYLVDPRGNILRGLAEVFCDLDPAYKSHDKVRVGVKGLPKRVILSSCTDWYHGYGSQKVRDIMNALAQYQGKPLVESDELRALWKDEGALLAEWEHQPEYNNQPLKTYPARGIRLKRFANGNGHLFFEPQELRDINMALAEYYGDVLPDCSEAKPTEKRTSTDVSKDLQYYPTPHAVVERVIADIYIEKGSKVLEPSCGCGRFMDALRKEGADVFGIEFDAGRVEQCRDKGHSVMRANFLETIPTGDYDRVVMNPPFYGKHYAKHVEHALKYLKAGGVLTAILPATARYDHGLLDGRWSDLPVGSFRDSGTNINTTVLTICR